MRRSRAPLTAWPAFADLMTILAVVGLTIAAIILVRSLGERGQIDEMRRELDIKSDQIAELESENEKLRRQLGQAGGTPEPSDIREIFGGDLPCLYDLDPPTRVPLLRVTVASEYTVTPLWPPEFEATVAAIPQLANAITHGQMGVEEFEQYSDAILQYGDRDDTFDGSCRFYVELKQGGAEPLAFMYAYGVIGQYFLMFNSSEVLGILRGEE